jgi:hypothetical protein
MSAWSSAVTNAGQLSVVSAAKLSGSFGLQARIVNTGQMYVVDTTPNAVASYSSSFQFDPNSVVMGGKIHDLFRALSSTGTQAVGVQVRATTGGYQVRATSRLANASTVYTTWATISDGSHSIKLVWVAASSSSVSNGSLSLSIDGQAGPSQINLANSTVRIDEVRLGAQSLSTGISGTEYFDTYTSTQ